MGPRRVTLMSYHYLRTRRRAGFHWIADACHRMGWDVVFVTAPISRISQLRRDFRFAYPVVEEANRLTRISERLASYVLFTPYHPISLRRWSLDRLTRPLVGRYARRPLGDLAGIVADSQVVIVESTPAIVLVPAMRAANPHARFVYRASDDLTFPHLATHPAVIDAEERLAPTFDLVSAASHVTVERLGRGTAVYHPHGIAKHLFDASGPSPYACGPNVVWVGTRWMDDRFIAIAAESLPGWHFHIIGPVEATVVRPNVHYYGELPFEETVPYIRHADVGLSTFPPLGSTGWSSHALKVTSLKTTQYSYCGLPIVAPSDLAMDVDGVFGYDVTKPASVRAALEGAVQAGRDGGFSRDVWSWDDLAGTLLGT